MGKALHALDAAPDPARRQWPVLSFGTVVVFAPHPDDETLGCGGLLASCADYGIPVSIVALTNGEASHHVQADASIDLAEIRTSEQERALLSLGLGEKLQVVRLGLPDGGGDSVDVDRVADAIDAMLPDQQNRATNGMAIFTTSVDDRHPDHRLAARLAADLATRRQPGAFLFSYRVWPPPAIHPALKALEVRYSYPIASVSHRKRLAISCHRSQFADGPLAGFEGFSLPDEVLDRAEEEQELFCYVPDPQRWLSLGSSPTPLDSRSPASP